MIKCDKFSTFVKLREINKYLILDYFNMNVDKRIRDWSKTELPKKSVGIGLTVLQQKLVKALLDDTKSSEQDIFTKLKTLVLEEVHFRHKWEQDVSI